MTSKEEYRNLPVTEVLQVGIAAGRPFRYVTHGPTGSWEAFRSAYGDNLVDAQTTLRMLLAFVFDSVELPFVITQKYDSCFDDAPSYRVTCYDVSYQQLMQLDTSAQPGWFYTIVVPEDNGFVVKLTPTRSLMKLIYATIFTR